MKRTIILITVLMIMMGCTNPKGARTFLEQQGFTSIEIKGFDLLAHGKDDLTTTAFTAIEADGHRVDGAVSDKGPLQLFRPRWSIRIRKRY